MTVIGETFSAINSQTIFACAYICFVELVRKTVKTSDYNASH